MNARRRIQTLLGLVLALVLVLSLVAPASAERRYREEVFEHVKVERDIVYGNAPVDGEPQDLLLDLYQPRGDDIARRPALIWAHGGGFAFGDKAEGIAPEIAAEFARKGYLVVSINYRMLVENGCSGAQGVTPECYNAAIEDVHDAQAAVRFLRANAKEFGIDKGRIAIGGESAGAVIACGVGVLSADPGSSGNPGPSSAVDAFVSISGGLPGGIFVDQNTAPGILFASEEDPIVPGPWSVETRNAMAGYLVPGRLTMYPGDIHVPVAEHGDEIEKRSTAFLYKHLELADTP